MKYIVGDMVNGTLNTFQTLQEAQECYAEYVQEGNLVNAELVKQCIGTDNIGNDIYPNLVQAAEFYYILDENQEQI